MRLGVIEYIDSAHYLPGHTTCGCMHGHTYKVEFIISGEKKGSGMVMDFYDMKTVLRKVLSEYDHRCLNEIVEFPSVENLCESIYGKLKDQIPYPFVLRMWEGKGKWCEMGEI
ncbi:6-pyruvoyl trahydropterin synthase family protein [Methanocella arvoryzae]|uniref:6-pyruvoyl-tetrahydropterin synthase n=1 Tax=Methanocella arvoryzae (strain DSM 22066 / NBRC 105507 / MRE50) TaxID=351160 RepID=Q0W7U3_METAR|nr:6-carboxytetrahydropterin synthase [Methanocella arvoryzae]CAJ35550.1 putative 6-pyruvoyl-tetrahydropterin synthase [Methanocella arvoryzae MRE50]